MIGTTWTATPAFVAGVLAARPAGVSACAAVVPAPAAVPAPVSGTRAPSVRLRALAGGMPFDAVTAGKRRIDDIQQQNTSTLGLHSPGRPLS